MDEDHARTSYYSPPPHLRMSAADRSIVEANNSFPARLRSHRPMTPAATPAVHQDLSGRTHSSRPRQVTPVINQRSKSSQRSRQPRRAAVTNTTPTELGDEKVTTVPPQQGQDQQLVEGLPENRAKRPRRPVPAHPQLLDKLSVDNDQAAAQPHLNLRDVHSKLEDGGLPQVLVTQPSVTAESLDKKTRRKSWPQRKEKSTQVPIIIYNNYYTGTGMTVQICHVESGNIYFAEHTPSTPPA